MPTPFSDSVRVSIAADVTLAWGEEHIAHVPSTGSFKLDGPTFNFLKYVQKSEDGFILIELNRQNGDCSLETSLILLQEHGIVQLQTNGTPRGADEDNTRRVKYQAELADLAVRRDLNWLSRFLTRIARVLALIWRFPVVMIFSSTLVLLLVIGAFRFDFERAYTAWIDHPFLVVVLTIVATVTRSVLHESGHVAAARRHGVHSPRCGVGFYVHVPVLYVDLTAMDTHRKLSRVHVDLGGIAMDGLTLAIAVAVVAWRFPNSEVALAVLSGLAFSSIGPLNPVTKSDLNWCGRDVFNARGMSTSWGRPRELIRMATSGVLLAERRFARALVTLSLVAFAIMLVAGIRSIAAVEMILREVAKTPISFVPLLTAWLLTASGVFLTIRTVRRRNVVE